MVKIKKISGNNKTQFRHVMAILIFTLVTFSVFLFVIFNQLYSSSKESIVQIHTNEVRNTASEFDFYFNAAINAITFCGNNMEVQHGNNATKADLERSMTIMSDTFMSYIQDNIAGVYGYVYGDYIDGHGWIPDASYDPKSRSWYTEARKRPGELVCVPPYIDAESGQICLTLSQTLSDDPESVVAFDIALNSLQTSIIKTMDDENVVSAKIIDRSQKVIVVSDKMDEELKGYQKNNILTDVDKYDYGNHIVRYKGKTYMIFIEPLSIGWDYVCIYDSSGLFNSMRYIYLASGAAIVIFIAMVLFMFYHFLKGQKSINNLLTRSETDALTGIRNRGSGQGLISEYLSDNITGALLMFDVDKFKSINDTYGHDIGDKVIIAVAKMLSGAARKNDVVMRLGGDEFVCFLYGVSRECDVLAFSNRLFSMIENISVEEVPELKVSVSVGVAIYDGKEKIDFSELYRRADEKIYISKKSVGNHISF